MKKSLLILGGGLVLGTPALSAQAQSLDPTFNRPAAFNSGFVYSATEQTDGKLVVTGGFSRLNGAPSASLVRFNTDGSLDTGFQQNVGSTSPIYRVEQLSNGQLLLVSFTSPTLISAGGISRNNLLRLNADGTADASFNPGAGTNTAVPSSSVDYAVPLPNGQVLAVGNFNSFNGTTANNLVRLTATGTVDPLFNSGSGPDNPIAEAAVLASGKYLVGGYFSTYNGTSRPGLARLNADGSLDPTFQTSLLDGSEVINLRVQPNGKILAAGYLDLGGSTAYALMRFNADGSTDNSFVPLPHSPTLVYSFYGRAIELQSDGKILVATPSSANSRPLARLNSDGSPDLSFVAAPSTQGFTVFSLTRRANGNVLVAGRHRALGPLPNNGLLELYADGSLNPGFLPLFLTTGSITNVVRQTDGKLVVIGGFTEIDGQLVSGLARFDPDGTLDRSYVGSVSLLDLPSDIALQPDGRLLLSTPRTVQRLLPSGINDNTFANASLTFSSLEATRLALQPDGRVLVSGAAASNGPAVVRLLPNGTGDASFTPAFGTGTARMSSIRALALQSDGQILVGGTFRPASGGSSITVRRLTAGGTFDNTFAGPTLTSSTTTAIVNSLAIQPDGKVVVGGQFSLPATNLLRLLPSGQPDAGFAAPTFTSGSITRVLVQPNGRILLGGLFGATGLPANLARLLSTGAADASFTASTAPNNTVRALLVQPDGALVVGGSFTTVGGQPSNGLARLIVPNVLAVAAPAAVAAATQAWPVPAHEQLSVLPDPAAHAQALELLDPLGRVVRHQTLRTGVATLRCDNLPAGLYLLRVHYAEGTVSRRIQLQ